MKADFVIDYLPNGSLSVTFPYDPSALQVVKAVPGRSWNKDKKYWTIPRTSLRALQEQCGRLGIGVSVSDTVRTALNMGQERQRALAAAKQDESPLELPTNTEPRPFQYAGIRFAKYALHNFKGALIADDMGLGKTFQALSLVAMHDRLQSILILCPNSLKYTWASEIEKHYPQLSYTVIAGTPEQRRELWASENRIKVANYEILLRDIEPRIVTWDLVVADEVGTMCKSYKAQRTKRTKKLRRRYSLGLSGTPLENRLEELHSVMDFVIPGLLGPGWLFVQQHVVKNNWGINIGYRGIEQVKERIAPYYIRRRKSDVLHELPDKVYNDVRIEMTLDEWELYDSIRKQIKEKISDNPKLNVSNILVEILRLKQATCDARLLDIEGIPSSKLDTIKDIVQASGDHKIVIFTQFEHLSRLIAEELECPVYSGPVSPEDRQRIVDNFQAGHYKCLVSTDAGAYGITLTEADIVIHADPTWNPMKMRQREDRLHRIGQKESVQVVNLICARTVDEKIRGILHRKLSIVKAIFDEENPEEFSNRITREDLLELLED